MLRNQHVMSYDRSGVSSQTSGHESVHSSSIFLHSADAFHKAAGNTSLLISATWRPFCRVVPTRLHHWIADLTRSFHITTGHALAIEEARGVKSWRVHSTQIGPGAGVGRGQMCEMSRDKLRQRPARYEGHAQAASAPHFSEFAVKTGMRGIGTGGWAAGPILTPTGTTSNLQQKSPRNATTASTRTADEKARG